jgi:hypothetical protein
MNMFAKCDKRRLYWLIDQYLSGNIDETTFCDEFYYSYNLEIIPESLTKKEVQAFSELSKVSSRFSQYETDQELDPRAFSRTSELKQKIIETRDIVRSA